MPTPDQPAPGTQPDLDAGLDDFDLDFEETVAPSRRRRLPLVTALLALSAAVGAGVVFGVLIQKHWGGGSNAGSGRNALASLAAARTGTDTTGTGQTGAAGAAPGALGAFARSGTAGQVKAIDGTALYVTDTDGNVVKVTTGPGVVVRVTKAGTLKSIVPGDFVVVQGTKTKTGYRATSISDTGTSGGLAGGLGGRNGASSGNGTGGGSGGDLTQPALPGLP